MPNTWKFLWAPLVDAWRHHRRWISGANFGMAAVLASLGWHPEALGQGATWPWMLLAAFTMLSATNDIATDGYTIEMLSKGQYGIANGLRIGFYNERIKKRLNVLDGIDLSVAEGELVCIVGPSGCGKTTTLRLIAGFIEPSAGEILVGGKVLSSAARTVPPEGRNMSMIFQSYALWPHMTVAENVAYGLKIRRLDKATIDSRLKAILSTARLEALAERYPAELSGGQQQRVSLARALVVEPETLLLDEPLSALDAKLRDEMRLELTRLQENVGITFIIVTHDQDEALSMASRIAVMDRGAVQQIATPSELYEHPASRFVADFIGKVNLIDAKVLSHKAKLVTCEAKGLGRLELPGAKPTGDTIAIAVRPEKLEIASGEPKVSGVIKVAGKVRDVAYYGDTSHVVVEVKDGLDLAVNVQNDSREGGAGVNRGQRVWVHWSPDDAIILAE